MIRTVNWALALQVVFGAQLLPQNVEIHPRSFSVSAARTASAPLIRVNTNLVLVPVLVTDRFGAPVQGLGASAFTVLEGKVNQRIVSLSNEDAPCSIGVILDLSGSMSDKLPLAAEVLHAFLQTANPDDEAFLLTVSTTPQIVSGFTNDFGLLQNSLLNTRGGGWTALNDAVYWGLQRMRRARNAHKALLVVSDGMDNSSRYSGAEILRLVDEADVQIFTLGIATDPESGKPTQLTEQRNGLAFLHALSDHSGGLNWGIGNSSDAAPAAAKLSRAIRDQYVIGYRPPAGNADSGKWRALRVKVNLPQLRVSSRTGYYSP